MSPMLTIERRPLPVAPRPFEAEVLGGWIGRLAARYRMTVPEFAARHELDLQIEDGGGWLTMPPLRSQSVDVLGALTRISRERIMAIHVPLPLTSKRTHFCYCARCVFLNPLDVTEPIWLGVAGPKSVGLPAAQRRVHDGAEQPGACVRKPRSVAAARQPARTGLTLWEPSQPR